MATSDLNLSSGSMTLLLFGSQAVSLTPSSIQNLFSSLRASRHNTWVEAILSELPELWISFSTANPKYAVLADMPQTLMDLYEWYRTGITSPNFTATRMLPNTIISPLLVLNHVSEYLCFLDAQSTDSVAIEGVLGFCTGLLGAFSAAAARDQDEFQRYGRIAIRIAVLIGGVVDVRERLDDFGPTRAIATAWSSDKMEEIFNDVLRSFPDSYISVAYDESRATVTTPVSKSEELLRALKKVGVVASELELRGRFHHASYAEDAELLISYCERASGLSLPDASELKYQTWSNTGSDVAIVTGSLHEHAIKEILTEKSEWNRTFQSCWSALRSPATSRIIVFGADKCIPPTVMRQLISRVTYMTDDSLSTQGYHKGSEAEGPKARKADDIAVIGMAIKVAGADDVDEFWDLLAHGKSQHREVPENRLRFENVWRESDPRRKWYGNFINDHDVFDHKFFKKSAREMGSTDPQQRHMMQIAYQALEQSGYFSNVPTDKKIGCYIGVCSADYENNAACHQPNAFTAIGNLKSFIAGKISHYFGWLGPSMCIDSACSSSLVSVHMACRAILSGECSAALAGGANIMTNSLWFENLAAASFLSPTGQCKPFDHRADGYCRGEGFAAVVLKKMSQAIADGDQILGTISSSAVYQNQNCTPVFVPNSPSLSDLFKDVVSQAQLTAQQVTVVEAHGTGTQVGDPAEYQSVRDILGGDNRSSPLALGSVKGLVGHTECASGAVSLVKILLMIGNKTIPAQLSFDTLNPSILASTRDNMEIVTNTRAWVPEADYYAALINNYGASGSNASVVVTEAPRAGSTTPTVAKSSTDTTVEVPIRFFGADERALNAYCHRLAVYLASKTSREIKISVSDLAFNLSRKTNPSLDKSVVFSCRSIDQLIQKLGAFQQGEDVSCLVSAAQKPTRHVILCFGGQVSTFIGLHPSVYASSKILRQHLHACDTVCKSLPGAGSIFPGMFERTPIRDPVRLQSMLFAMQYACARSWMDCGVKPAAVVGHSFGELVALCVSGVLSLEDGLRMVVGRAAVIRNLWGTDKGSMIAVEGDLEDVKNLLVESEGNATISCFNGPTSFTLAGTTTEIEAVAQTLAKPNFTKLRFKQLDVTNAFHSHLVEGLIPDLVQVGEKLMFREPQIAIELATELHSSVGNVGARYVADHMRKPVYFNHAIRRLAQEYKSCIFLEAGSNSTITRMASRALGSPADSFFQAVNITDDGGNGKQTLCAVTLNLWKEGLPLAFWPHHRVQTYEYSALLLPPYQFEKSRHWIEMKAPPKALAPAQNVGGMSSPEKPLGLFSFLGYRDQEKHARFRINTETEEYSAFVAGHMIAKTAPICPATLIVDIAIEALMSICPELAPSQRTWWPQIHEVNNHMAVCVDPTRTVTLEFDSRNPGRSEWAWKVLSSTLNGTDIVHASGQLVFARLDDPQTQSEFKRFERLTCNHQYCIDVLNTSSADEIIHGARSIYRAFREVVDYAEPYKGLWRLVGKGSESAGRVVKRYAGKTWLDTHLSDCFSQVAGIWVNCMTDCSLEDMFIATGFERWIRSPTVDADYVRPEVWDVLARHEKTSEKTYLSDISIFDPTSGRLVEVILGITYHKVSKASMGKTLARLTPSLSETSSAHINKGPPGLILDLAQQTARTTIAAGPVTKEDHTSGIEVADTIRSILADISGLEVAEITADTLLADIGIDSLMGMELGRELEGAFKTPLMSDELACVMTCGELVDHVAGVLGVLSHLEDHSSEENDHGDVDSTSPKSSELASSISTPPESEPEDTKLSSDHANTAAGSLQLSAHTIFDAFEKSKRLTDDLIAEHGCAAYTDTVLPRQTQLCIALAIEAFESLGCHVRSASAGEVLPSITYPPEHQRLVEWLYRMLEHDARLIDISPVAGVVTRTATAAPTKPSDVLVSDILREYPDHHWANRLTFFAGRRLADVLRGEQDGIKLIFGTDEGRELVTGLYGDSLLNNIANAQMQDILRRLIQNIPTWDSPLKVMELGAGTGGTTKNMVAMLARLGVPIEYTFSDLSGSFVAAARKRFAKEYPSMKFRVHDIEKAPASDLSNTQHVVIASNAIHATRSLQTSVSNIRKLLRQDGFLMMLEMTTPLHWVDMIFGLFEGWWLFDDGRRHAIAHQSRWQRDLWTAGYGRVDWTDGWRPESEIQRIIIAQASAQPGISLEPSRMAFEAPQTRQGLLTDSQKLQLDEYVREYAGDFNMQKIERKSGGSTCSDKGLCVAVTGATGSLGAHLVAHLASLPSVKAVFCLNRPSRTVEAVKRQLEAFDARGIKLTPEARSKVKVLAVETAKSKFGLEPESYSTLVQTVTHIVHNSWAMSSNRPVSGMESQFKTMRNLIDLARDMAVSHQLSRPGLRVVFQFISSIAVMGRHSLLPGNSKFAPEDRATADQLLPSGYGQAKWVCERMLDETLHRYPESFRATSVRPGQIAGNSINGYWNEMEHLPFLFKSSQTLRALPALEGDMCWTPVDWVAGTVADLLLLDPQLGMYPIYHIDNPVRQSWSDMLPLLALELGVPEVGIIPFEDWVRKVRAFPGNVDDNPAARLIDFLDDNFVRMSCGGMMLDTKNACEHSRTLHAVGTVSREIVKRYLEWWKLKGFLHS
ncbi:hypothetical protein F5B18DRAFT_631325 [Nemania serpens]|nr:hypothetical protein F5B18DRAFT_631325 [Nemania serpens]